MTLLNPSRLKTLSMLSGIMMLSSCYTFKIATKAQSATDELQTTTVHTYSLFWGAVNKHQTMPTPNCDALGSLGMAEVKVKTNFGYALITVATLGIYCPMEVVYKCSKPCPQDGEL